MQGPCCARHSMKILGENNFSAMNLKPCYTRHKEAVPGIRVPGVKKKTWLLVTVKTYGIAWNKMWGSCHQAP